MQKQAIHSQIIDDPSQGVWSSSIVFCFLVLLCAVALRLSLLDEPLFYDEFYNVLAGTSWANDGSLTLYEGAYERASLYTQMTGMVFKWFGTTDVVAARAPNVFFGVGLVVLASVWVRTVSGPITGWIAALFLLMWPSGIQMSQIVRFYAVHGFLFFILAIAIYDLCMPDRSTVRRIIALVISAFALWLSLQFQDSTLVGLLAICVWISVLIVLPTILQQDRMVIFGVVGISVLVLIVGGMVLNDTIAGLWGRYRNSPWDSDPTAYHRALRNLYPTFWPMTPVFALLAVARFPRPASFCIAIAGIGLLVHSFAAVQNIRHIYYLSPFLFAIWAMGLQVIGRPILDYLCKVTQSTLAPRGRTTLSSLIVGFVILFAVIANNAAMDTLKGLRRGILPQRTLEVDYTPAQAAISAYRDKGFVFVVANDLEAVKYFDGFDVNFSRNWLPIMNGEEFAVDPRTGRPMISKNESLSKIVQAYPHGIFVTTRDWWTEWPSQLQNNFIAFLEVFNQPNVSWQLEHIGNSVILAWRSQAVDTAESERIRALID